MTLNINVTVMVLLNLLINFTYSILTEDFVVFLVNICIINLPGGMDFFGNI
jgi:hypothetical protein